MITIIMKFLEHLDLMLLPYKVLAVLTAEHGACESSAILTDHLTITGYARTNPSK